MLIEFTVGNYLSFKDKKTLSLEATSIKEHPENIITVGKYKLLRSIAIYGANSSGKSNLLKAMSVMSEIITSSAKKSSSDEIDVTPFLLSTETENKPSFFEILFLIEGVRYRYGFEVDKKQVYSEWFFESEMKKEKLLFIRQKDIIEVSDEFKEGVGLEEKTRNNALFLSVVDQFNGTTAKIIIQNLSKLFDLSGLKHESNRFLSDALLDTDDKDNLIKEFLSVFDLGFNRIIKRESKFGKDEIFTMHNKYDREGIVVDNCQFSLLEQESSGTNKLYDISGYIILSLMVGGVTIIDELDAKLHPILTSTIIKLYHSIEKNYKNAQLIFSTHDTNLLSSGNFRRDQIYFTEKDRFEATDLYSLVEYKEPDGTKVRNDRSFEKDYIAGRYGAIPYIGDLSKLLSDGKSSED